MVQPSDLAKCQSNHYGDDRFGYLELQRRLRFPGNSLLYQWDPDDDLSVINGKDRSHLR